MGRTYVRRQRRLVNRETVILAGDHDLPAGQVLNRMVRTVVPKLHLCRLRARSEPKQLVPETDSKHRNTFGQEFADRLEVRSLELVLPLDPVLPGLI